MTGYSVRGGSPGYRVTKRERVQSDSPFHADSHSSLNNIEGHFLASLAIKMKP